MPPKDSHPLIHPLVREDSCERPLMGGILGGPLREFSLHFHLFSYGGLYKNDNYLWPLCSSSWDAVLGFSAMCYYGVLVFP